KALLLKKISDAEISSKEKKTQAGQSLTKAETLKQQDIAANTSSNNTAVKSNETNATGDQKSNPNNTNEVVNTTLPVKDNVFLPVTDNTTVPVTDNKTVAVNDNTTLPVKDNTASTSKTNETINANTNTASSENQSTYKEPAAKEQIVKAELLNKEADVVMGQSVELKSQAAKSKNTNTKNTIYAQSEELMKEGQDKKLQASQLTATANTTQFDSNQNELDQLASASSTNSSAEILKAEITNDEAKTFFDNAKKQRIKASTTESYSAKETELEAARKNEMNALEKQKEAMDIYKKYNPNFVASAVNTADNNSATNKSLNSGTSTIPVTNAVVNNAGGNTSTALNTNSAENTTLPLNSTTSENIENTAIKTSSSSEVKLSANEVFDQKSTLVYSFKNPIPINKKLPEGLIFKVQIGAFRKPIPQDLFQGMSPITGETTPKGFIRYTVGVFEKFTTADKIKNKIIGMGYKDAFIVAFLNGKRIPINEAYAMAGGVPATVLQINNPIANTEKNTVVTTNELPAIDQKTDDLKTNELKAIAKTESVTTVQGLFYTVQVGVFSQPVVAGKLYNMKPLYTETAANGNLRYYTGIYKSVSRAAEATEMINDVGIKDAFVTAYYNGKRISLAEAKQYEKQGDAVFSTSASVNKLPVFTALPKQSLVEERAIVDITDIVQPAANNSASNQINKDANPSSSQANNSGIIYKIQIGAFNDEVPLEIANKFIKIASKGIKTYKDNNGLTVYTVGNLKTYDEANSLKSEVVAESLTDAFIIAFRNGEKIPVEEARK
ncbi:MAG: hypothetical protein Q8L90_00680, partial [Bacteroidota bacterium]|nr:hypothetical protein [Bacteroidota bacterium]